MANKDLSWAGLDDLYCRLLKVAKHLSVSFNNVTLSISYTDPSKAPTWRERVDSVRTVVGSTWRGHAEPSVGA